MLLRAATVLPMDGPPLAEGMVRIAGELITDVGHDLRPAPGEAIRRLPHQILLPGFINAHLHLDLSFTYGPLPPTDGFVPWLRQIALLRQRATADDLAAGLTMAVEQLLEGGTTTVGDYVGDVRIVPMLARTPLTGRGFLELIANDREAATLRQRTLAALCAPRTASTAWDITLTPHAPYSLDADTLHAILTRHNRAPQAPLAIHCAESRNEWRYCTAGDGPLADLLRQYDFAAPPRCRSPLDLLHRHGGLPARSCLIHGNELDDEDMALIRAAECTVVHCPQSHRYFGHTPFPLERLQHAGVPIALGTDGLPCADTLNLLTELRLLRQNWPQLSAEALLHMATRNGAAALWYTDRGRLAPGLRADLVAVPWSTATGDPYEAVLRNRTTSLVMIGGRLVRDLEEGIHAIP